MFLGSLLKLFTAIEVNFSSHCLSLVMLGCFESVSLQKIFDMLEWEGLNFKKEAKT